MAVSILGLHHATATVGEAQADLDFCLAVLGLRLVKKTVNFDNHHVYHFYYGDQHGTPGTIWTTFPYHGHGVRVGARGAGQVTVTSFSVPASALPFWRARVIERGHPVADVEPRFGEHALVVTDPSGLLIELVATDDDQRAPWTGGGVPDACALRGLHSVTLTVQEAEPTIDFMTEWLGYETLAQTRDRVRVGVNGGGPGRQMEIVIAPTAPPAINGIGTVHHVAMAVADQASQVELRDALVARGIPVTPVMDRQYFKSIYFREPGGVLFEVATVEPGFGIDEPEAELGRALKLPAWEEVHRAEIERGLVEVHY